MVKLLLILAAAAAALQDDKPKTGRFKRDFADSYALLDVPKSYTPKKKYGLIVMLHGAGGRPEHYAAAYQDAVRKDYIVVLPAARPKSREEFARTTFDEKDTEQILKLIEELAGAYSIDRDRVFLSGHSAGAAYSFWLVARRPDLFTACAAGASGLRFEAATMKGAEHVPFYIVAGKKDSAHAEAEASVKPLRDAGFEVKFDDPAEWGHSLPPEAWKRMFAWFDALCPPDQAALLQAAREALARKKLEDMDAALKKLLDRKDVTPYSRRRAGRIAREKE